MIIVLKGADFSANNLGKIDIKRELSAETEALLKNYSLPLSDKQKSAVDDFVLDLRSSGIYDKITCLLLPCLAANIDEAMINVITNENMGVLNPTYWSIRNRGLAQSSTTYGTTDAITRISAYKNVPINNSHYAVFNSEEYEFADTTINSKLFPTRRNSNATFYDNIISSTDNFWIQAAKYGGVSTIPDSSEVVSGMLFNDGTEQKLQLHQINLYNSMFSVRHGDKEKGSRDGYSYPDTFIDDVSFCSNGNNGYGAHALYSFGFALTDDEQIAYARLVKSLMDVILS
jgi:hypothetical protein